MAPKLQFMRDKDYQPDTLILAAEPVFAERWFEVESDEGQLEVLAEQAPEEATHVDFAYWEGKTIVRDYRKRTFPRGDSHIFNIDVMYFKVPDNS